MTPGPASRKCTPYLLAGPGGMPLALRLSEGLGLDFRRALRLTDWLTGALEAFLSQLGVGCLDPDGRRNCVHSCRRRAKKQVVRAVCRPVPHARWFWRGALHCFREFSKRLPWGFGLLFSPLGAPRQIPRTPKDVSAAVVEGGSRSRAWPEFKDRCPIFRIHPNFVDDEGVMCFELHGCGKASPGSALSSHLRSRR